MQTVCKLLYLPFKKYKICLQVTCTCDMANKDITVKCDEEKETIPLPTNVDTISKLRKSLEKNGKQYPVVLYKGEVSKLRAPIPMDRNELLHFISRIGKI